VNLGATSSVQKHSALFITDVRLVPAFSGNRSRILSFIRTLRELGLQITLVAPPDVMPIEQLRLLVDVFVPVRARRFTGGRLSSFDWRPFRHAINAAAKRYHPMLAVVQYVWLAPAMADLPHGIERWIDCHDLLHERTERFLAVGLDPWVICSWEEERARLSYGDLLLATQERETTVLQSLLPDKRVKCVPTPADLPPHFLHQPGRGKIVLAVGTRHAGNMGIVEFAREAWPRVLSRIPDARLQVVGSIGAALDPQPGVDILGEVPDLLRAYAESAVVACPVTVGTGIKTKLVEALRYGKAVVATTTAVEGMTAPEGPAWIAAESLPACADAIAVLLNDSTMRASMERAAFAFGLKYYSLAAFREQIAALLPHASGVSQRSTATTALPADLRFNSISVIVPALGWPDTLSACLCSLQEQRVAVPFDITVVVNGPDAPDPGQSWPGVRIIYERTPGPAAARNAGVRACTGDVLAFIDADCTAAPAWLAAGLAAVRQASPGSIVAGAIARSGPRGSGVALYDRLTYLRQQDYVGGGGGCATANLLVHRNIFEHVGPFDVSFREAAFEDWEWAMRARKKGVALLYADTAVVDHPCMSELAALRRKAERLARGEIQMQRKLDQPIKVPGLLAALRQQVRKAMRHRQIGVGDRVRLLGIAMAVAYWGWRAAHAHRREIVGGT
jgi:glycosyltransferase involved in cell wall biosynthesis/GT2 family glycosyltransferase